MSTRDYVSSGEARHWRRKALAAALLAFLVVLAWVASKAPVGTFASPWLPITVGVLVSIGICVWFPFAVRAWNSTDQTRPKNIRGGLPERVDAREWQAPDGGVLVGVTTPLRGTDVDGTPFAVWQQSLDPHVLLCGPTGRGKTAAVRWIALALIQAGHDVGFIDGKSGGSYAAFAGREHVLGVADEPDEWAELAGLVRDEMRTRFHGLREWRYGKGEKPNLRPVALIVDELVDVVRIAGNSFQDPLEEITRMGREGGGRLFCSVLRPDVGQSVSGLVRDSLSGRVFLGRPSLTSAQMVFEDDMKAARAAADGADGVRGRGVARFGGTVFPVQLPFVADPVEDRAAEKLLPPIRVELTPFERMVTARQSAAGKIRELHGQGLGYQQLAQRLNADGYRQANGKPWDAASVRMADG